VDQNADSSLKNVSLPKLQGVARMGFILVVAVLSLAIFVSISNTVFSLVAQTRAMSQSSELPDKN